MMGVSAVLLGLAVVATVTPSRAVAQEHGAAGHAVGPGIGQQVEVGLVQTARFSLPAQPNNPAGGAQVQSFSGKLLQFDQYWVGVEAPGSGARIWVARENVAYLLSKPAGAQATQPATGGANP
jgi:hypothetical protein